MTDLNTYSSTIFFTHRIQLGVSFTDAKSEAIKTGDLSGETIHPALVHISYMWGSVLWQGLHSENYLDDERSLFKLAMDCLEDGSCRSPDPVESLQACYLLSIYCFTRQDLARGRQFHIDAAQVIADNQLHISDPHHPVQSPFDIEQMHAVCQLLLSDSTPVNPFKMESSLSRALVHELERVIVSRVILKFSLIIKYSVPFFADNMARLGCIHYANCYCDPIATGAGT